jgi:hypothetical protein
MMAHARLVRTGIADGDLFPFQNLGTAGLVEADGVGHGFILVIGNTFAETTLTGVEFQLSQDSKPVKEKSASAIRRFT